MESYGGFALVYDEFMEELPMGKWVDYIEKIWSKHKIKVKDVLDLGCGTGNASIMFNKRGYGVVAVDLSENMLSIARDKAYKEKADILFLNQDMRELELYGTVEAVVCLCDTVNYILENEELLHVFRLIHNYIVPGGIFIFDINTIHKYKNILADNSFCSSNANGAYIWQNYYDTQRNINEYYTDFYIKKENGLYERFEEEHYQKAYSLEEIENLLKEAGLRVLEMHNDYEFAPANECSERVTFVVIKDEVDAV